MMKTLLKKINISILTLLVAVSFVGCGSNNQVGEDLTNFMNNGLHNIQTKANEVIKEYNDYTNNPEMKPDELLKKLNDSIIPTYQTCVEEAEALLPETDEVKEIKELYIAAAKIQLEALRMITDGISTQDTEKYNAARTLTDEANSAFIKYYSKVKLLAAENEVLLSGTGDVTEEGNHE